MKLQKFFNSVGIVDFAFFLIIGTVAYVSIMFGQVAKASPIVDAEECEVGTTVRLAPIDELMFDDDDYREMLYTFKGEREVVKLPKLSRKQADLLLYAYGIAKSDGHKDPSVLQGLIWQESRAGGFKGYEVAGDEFGLRFGKRYYGVGQIKVAAAKDVFKRYAEDFPGWTERTDEEIIAYLIMDDKFNIRVASKYLLHVQHNEQTKYVRPINYAITAYNRGLGNTYGTDFNNWHYTVSVNKYKDGFIKDFNKEFALR